MTTHIDQHGKLIIDSKLLRAASYSFNIPFDLLLAEGHIFSADHIVRIIPGKRMVAFGTWQGHRVVAKLFFDRRHAKRHQQEDVNGMKLLQTNKVPSPALFYEGQSKDKTIYVLLYEEIVDAENLYDIWEAKRNLDEQIPLLKQVVIEIATQHVLGMEQKDLHLKNFLITPKKIYTIDGAQIKCHPYLLNKALSIENLALFLSQLGAGLDHVVKELFLHYAKSRGWRLKQHDHLTLLSHIKRIHVDRWQQFDKKLFRNSSDFATFHHRGVRGMYCRSHETKTDILRFLQDPESFFQQPDKMMLKDGNSSTVIKVVLDGQEMVIKRYNIKNFWHYLRRCLRYSRAHLNWRIAHKLALFHVAVPKPILYLEKNFLGLRGKSYFMSEYVPSLNTNEILSNSDRDHLVNKITQLFKSLMELEITHGDLKISNFIFDDHHQPLLVDFDGAAEHASLSSLRWHWKKEIRRFIKNFSAQPELKQQFEKAFKTLV